MKSVHYLSSMVIALFLYTGTVSCQSGEPLFPEMPGLVSYTHRTSFEKDVAATLDTIKTLGITDMEFSNLFGKTQSPFDDYWMKGVSNVHLLERVMRM